MAYIRPESAHHAYMDTLKNWNTATNTTTSLTGSDGFCTLNCSRPRSKTGIFQSSKQLQSVQDQVLFRCLLASTQRFSPKQNTGSPWSRIFCCYKNTLQIRNNPDASRLMPSLTWNGRGAARRWGGGTSRSAHPSPTPWSWSLPSGSPGSTLASPWS